MIRSLAACVMAGVVGLSVAVAEDKPKAAKDPIAAELKKAKDAYVTAVKAAGEKLIAAFEEEETKARKGKLSNEQYIKLSDKLAIERKAFEADPTRLPKSSEMTAAVREFSKSVGDAESKCKDAFSKAAKAYRETDPAVMRQVMAEKEQFFKALAARTVDWKLVAGELNECRIGDTKTDLDGLKKAFDTGGVAFARVDEFRTRLLTDLETMKTARDAMLGEKTSEKDREAAYRLALSKLDALLAPYNDRDWGKSGVNERNAAHAGLVKMRDRFVKAYGKR